MLPFSSDWLYEMHKPWFVSSMKLFSSETKPPKKLNKTDGQARKTKKRNEEVKQYIFDLFTRIKKIEFSFFLCKEL